MLTSYAPSLPSSEDQAEYPLEHHHHQQQQHHAATTGQHQCSPAGTAKPRLERPPPRSHILQTPVFQVVNANTVKDRYLFLFNDLLIICKPIMDENIIVGDHHSAKEARYRFRPNENSLFQVKNIVELSKLTLYLSRDDQQKPSVSLAAAPRKMHPLLASALRKFETNPDAAIAYLVDKSVLANEPLSIANFLFKTPDLCRHQLGDFLADPKNSDIYDAFLDCFRMVALRLDEALRILLMTLRLPSKWEALEYVIERFSKKWHDANQNVVKFHEDMVVKVVVAMLFLNAEWWYDASSELDVFWSAREHKERRDRQRLTRRASMYILVSFDFLRDMYNSIAHERLETGWDNDVEASDAPEQDTIITVTPYRFPTRLTRSVPSAPITISIAAPDPGLQIKLRGQDIECHPNVLDFSDSCIQTFTITGHTLGRTSLMFIKSGPHASRYVSPTLPRTKSIVVERPFMRYTFQIAFSHVDMRLPPTAAAAAANAVTTPTTATAAAGSNTTPGTTEAPSGAVTGKDDDKTIAAAAGTTDEQEPKSPVMVRRKYIFSVETEQERTEWISWLKTLSGHVHVNGATATTNNNNNN
ncbi:Sec7 domain-containing protein, partial [Zychaea mexicana]|uniref:Sec7 domain-containing protein n=1 Tax=Zychaea mexicana TaxID=64656 RepID=UPI0022FE0DD8